MIEYIELRCCLGFSPWFISVPSHNGADTKGRTGPAGRSEGGLFVTLSDPRPFLPLLFPALASFFAESLRVWRKYRHHHCAAARDIVLFFCLFCSWIVW